MARVFPHLVARFGRPSPYLSAKLYQNVTASVPESDPPSQFSRLCDCWGSDEDSIDPAFSYFSGRAHNYGVMYTNRLSPKRYQIDSVLEYRTGTTNSDFPSVHESQLRSRRFSEGLEGLSPRAFVLGTGIDPGALFGEELAATSLCDQTDEKTYRGHSTVSVSRQFDLIVDDGLHRFQVGVTLFQNSSNRLKQSGSDVVADVTSRD